MIEGLQLRRPSEVFCGDCGTSMTVTQIHRGRFYRETGNPIRGWRADCPNRPNRRSLRTIFGVGHDPLSWDGHDWYGQDDFDC